MLDQAMSLPSPSSLKIALILPYFGKFPNYFPLWLESAGCNADIDFFIFTDNDDVYQHEKNIHFVRFDLPKVRQLIRTKLKMNCCLSEAYKLCDYKVAYGVIFEDYIKEFDFWGYCDVDVIWGNIRAFITDDILRSYDKILELGHLTLLRNQPKFNRIFLDWKSAAPKTFYEASHLEKNVGFDEVIGMIPLHRFYCREGKMRIYNNLNVIADIFPFRDCYKTYWSYEDDAPFICEYDNGGTYALLVRGREVERKPLMYVHLQKRPMEIQTDDRKRFLMAKRAFLPYREVTASDIENYNSCTDVVYSVGKKKHCKEPLWRRILYNRIVGRSRKFLCSLLHYRCDMEFRDVVKALRIPPPNKVPQTLK